MNVKTHKCLYLIYIYPFPYKTSFNARSTHCSPNVHTLQPHGNTAHSHRNSSCPLSLSIPNHGAPSQTNCAIPFLPDCIRDSTTGYTVPSARAAGVTLSTQASPPAMSTSAMLLHHFTNHSVLPSVSCSIPLPCPDTSLSPRTHVQIYCNLLSQVENTLTLPPAITANPSFDKLLF